MPSAPKTNKFTNRHAEEARIRDSERAGAAQSAAQKAREDAQWRDDDPRNKKKEEKVRLEAEKAEELERRRAERLEQLESEEREFNASKVPTKVQKRATQKDVAKLLAAYDKEYAKVRPTLEEPTALPSAPVNHQIDRSGAEVSASEITAAIAALDLSKGIPEDRHIGKRARVLYRLFYEANLPKVKEAHRGLKRSQYNDRLWEMWQSSPQNPFVQRKEVRNAERLDAERNWFAGEVEEDLEE
jgi:hypothetical protein